MKDSSGSPEDGLWQRWLAYVAMRERYSGLWCGWEMAGRCAVMHFGFPGRHEHRFVDVMVACLRWSEAALVALFRDIELVDSHAVKSQQSLHQNLIE